MLKLTWIMLRNPMDLHLRVFAGVKSGPM